MSEISSVFLLSLIGNLSLLATTRSWFCFLRCRFSGDDLRRATLSFLIVSLWGFIFLSWDVVKLVGEILVRLFCILLNTLLGRSLLLCDLLFGLFSSGCFFGWCGLLLWLFFFSFICAI